MSDVCNICNKPELVFYRLIHECERCEEMTCSECSETDYDFGGDPGRYVCTQWICNNCVEEDNRARVRSL